MKKTYQSPCVQLFTLSNECMLHEISTHIGRNPATEEDEGGRARNFDDAPFASSPWE